MTLPLSPVQSSTLDGLSKQFVSSLRTLFEILDDKGTGYVKFSDIEVRWEDDGSKSLPKGVIESLRKVTPPNGLLSFERFCAGLKICLLRNQMEGGSRRSEEKQRPPSAPLLDLEPQSKSWSQNPVRLPGVSQQRTLSMPQLQPSHLYGPPKPPRVGLPSGQVDKAEIRSALHNWQLGVMMEEERRYPRNARALPEPPVQTRPAEPQNSQQNQFKKINGRRREPRRHTLQNGIDYNMMKRMKQLEEEKEVLVEGLAAVDRAREWYLKQMSVVQDKIHYANRMGYSDQWSDAQDERVGLQRARILEVNRHLGLLTEPGERGGLPLHINLALHSQSNHILSQLKNQNHFLTQEINKKNERITALEREKASLMRELFHTRSRSQQHDTTQFL